MTLLSLNSAGFLTSFEGYIASFTLFLLREVHRYRGSYFNILRLLGIESSDPPAYLQTIIQFNYSYYIRVISIISLIYGPALAHGDGGEGGKLAFAIHLYPFHVITMALSTDGMRR
jgi:hypothetical protein